MKLPDLPIIREYSEIPKVFYSTETGRPFSRCVSCEKHLLTTGEQYVIEKAIRNYQKFKTNDTIFEYAMCVDCYAKIQKSFSVSSKQAVENYFLQNVNFAQRRTRLLEEGNLRLDEWISHCIVKETPVQDLDEYQILCQCHGDKMLFTYLPFMIGGDATDEIVQLLSNETLGEIDGLRDDFFGLSPELQGLLNDPRFFVV